MKLDINTLITAVIGGIIGAIINSLIGEPLKKWVRGEYKAEKLLKNKERQKQIIIEYFRAQKKSFMTDQIRKELFPKLKIEEVYRLLKELEDEKTLKSIRFDGGTIDMTAWHCIW